MRLIPVTLKWVPERTTDRGERISHDCAAKPANIPAGVSPAGGTCPVASVVIFGGDAGDQIAGSPEVNVPVGLGVYPGQIRQGGKQLDRW
jgi:hypothetical protein